jgi:hypothetical protein
MDVIKRQMISKTEKCEDIHERLKRLSKESQRLIDKALELGEIDKARELQDHNIKVLAVVKLESGVRDSRQLKEAFAKKQSYDLTDTIESRDKRPRGGSMPNSMPMILKKDVINLSEMKRQFKAAKAAQKFTTANAVLRNR